MRKEKEKIAVLLGRNEELAASGQVEALGLEAQGHALGNLRKLHISFGFKGGRQCYHHHKSVAERIEGNPAANDI